MRSSAAPTPRRSAPGGLALALACALGGVGLASGRAAAAEPEGVIFRFGAGSALFARPGLGADGSLFVGSGEGYVHALAADGRYRWSYTLRGRIVAPPVQEEATGRVFVVTSDARLYALEGDGTLRWVFPLPVPPKSELSLTSKGMLLFVGADQYLYGITSSGQLVLRLAAAGARSAPVALRAGGGALLGRDALLRLRGFALERAPLAQSFEPDATLALEENQAISGCAAGRAFVIDAGQQPLLSVKSDCLAPPVSADGFFAIAEVGGVVRLLRPDGAAHRVLLGDAPLRPVWDAPRQRLILSTARGSIVVLDARALTFAAGPR